MAGAVVNGRFHHTIQLLDAGNCPVLERDTAPVTLSEALKAAASLAIDRRAADAVEIRIFRLTTL